jgi:methionyl-tRNA formyltransferase
MRVVFMGTPKIASGILEELIVNKYNVVAVVTQPDKKVGRKQLITKSAVKKTAEKYDIKVIQPKKIRNEFQEVIDCNPDIIITCAYGQIIPNQILDYPKYKCINIHGSLLPKYRGGSPIQTAIKNGEEYTGITIMYMAEKMDAGDMLVKEKVKIEDEDTTETMFDKLEECGKHLLIKNLPKIIKGELVAEKQNEDDVSFAWNIKKEEEYINFNRSNQDVYNHIRSLISWPVGYAVINGKKTKFHKVSKTDEILGEPGEFIGLINDKIVIGTNNGSILVEELQMEGKSKQIAKVFYNGAGRSLVGKVYDFK